MKYTFIGLTLLGIAFLIGLGIFVFLRPKPPEVQWSSAVSIPIDEVVEVKDGPLTFRRAVTESELDRFMPNTIYAFEGSLVRARFEYDTPALTRITHITVYDRQGRPWISANLDDSSVFIEKYRSEHDVDSSESLLDRDGDGVPDKRVDYCTLTAYERSGAISWREIKKTEGGVSNVQTDGE